MKTFSDWWKNELSDDLFKYDFLIDRVNIDISDKKYKMGNPNYIFDILVMVKCVSGLKASNIFINSFQIPVSYEFLKRIVKNSGFKYSIPRSLEDFARLCENVTELNSSFLEPLNKVLKEKRLVFGIDIV